MLAIIGVACLAFLAAALVVLGAAVITVAKVPHPKPNKLGLIVAWAVIAFTMVFGFVLLGLGP
jgi:hypothetical protein